MVQPYTQSILLEGQITSKQEKTYLHLPFQMPDHAVRLDVEYDYSNRISSDPRLKGGNTIDLGIFDERGIDFLQAGFRGFSGSDRSRFWITPGSSSPGYLPGPLNPGLWHIMLGLYKIAPQGCFYKVNISIQTTPSTIPGNFANQSPHDLPSALPQHYQPGDTHHQWLRGELHCHTWHSDGELAPEDLVSLARERGMDFLVIADHNTNSAQMDLEKLTNPGLVLIRGVEATTFKGHFNCIGIPNWIDFRVQSAEDMREALQYARNLGAFTSCNHPKPLGPDWEYRGVTLFDSVEVWNGPWTGLNEMSLEYWSQLLASGRQIPAVGGSDFHRLGDRSGLEDRNIGSPTNWVRITGIPKAGNILQAIRNGHIFISEHPHGPFLDLSDFSGAIQGGDLMQVVQDGNIGMRVRCQNGAGSILRMVDQRSILFQQEILKDDETFDCFINPSSSLFCRAELRYPDERLRALSNPVYFASC